MTARGACSGCHLRQTSTGLQTLVSTARACARALALLAFFQQREVVSVTSSAPCGFFKFRRRCFRSRVHEREPLEG